MQMLMHFVVVSNAAISVLPLRMSHSCRKMVQQLEFKPEPEFASESP